MEGIISVSRKRKEHFPKDLSFLLIHTDGNSLQTCCLVLVEIGLSDARGGGTASFLELQYFGVKRVNVLL